MSSTSPTANRTNSDWLGPSLSAAKAIAAAADSAPFPYVRSIFVMAVVVLESIEVGTLCTLQGVLDALKKLQSKPKGIRGHLKEVLYSSGVADEISGYDRKIQELRLNFILTTNLDTNRQVHLLGSASGTDSTLMQGKQYFTNCPPASRMFQGRQNILDNMQHFFSQHDLGKQRIYVLYGLGGGGKTQTALKFIERSHSQFSSTCLIDTSTKETIDTAFKDVAVKQKIGDTAKDAIQWFTAQKDEWLIVFDNADEPNIDLNKFFPPCKHGNIIITTRNPGLCVYAGANTHVNNMEEADAAILLLKTAALDDISRNRETATTIVKKTKELEYLPLAIIQAGAFIARSRNLEGFLTIYATNKSRLLNEKPAQSHDSYEWTVYTTWQMSFNRLSPLAARFLQLCSLLHHKGISEEFFINASKYRCTSAIPTYEDLGDSLAFLSEFVLPGETWNGLRFQEITAEIMAYSLMEFDPDQAMFSMHPLVHGWCQSIIIEQEACRSSIIGILGMCIGCIPEHDTELQSMRLVLQVDALLHRGTEMFPDFEDQYARIYYSAGHYTKAEKLWALALQKHREVLGDDHQDILRIMTRLAGAYKNLAQYEKAKTLLFHVLDKQRQILGNDHRDTLDSIRILVLNYNRLGQYENALELGLMALEKRKEIMGKDHPDTVSAMDILGMLYGNMGRFEEGMKLLILVLEKRRQSLGDNHPKTLLVMNNLSVLYLRLGKFEEAKYLLMSLVEKRVHILGQDHPDSLISVGNLAATYRSLGKFAKAQELYMSVFQKNCQVLGLDHPQTLRFMSNMAMTYNYLGQYGDALKLYISVVEKRRQILGDVHVDTVTSIHYLGDTYNYLGQFEEALKLNLLALEKRQDILGEAHPDTLKSMASLAITYGALGNFVEAKRLQVYVLEKRRKTFGEDHPDTLRTMVHLKAMYYNLGNIEEANKLALPAPEKLMADHHPNTQLLINSLAAAVNRMAGKVEKAEELAQFFHEYTEKCILNTPNLPGSRMGPILGYAGGLTGVSTGSPSPIRVISPALHVHTAVPAFAAARDLGRFMVPDRHRALTTGSGQCVTFWRGGSHTVSAGTRRPSSSFGADDAGSGPDCDAAGARAEGRQEAPLPALRHQPRQAPAACASTSTRTSARRRQQQYAAPHSRPGAAAAAAAGVGQVIAPFTASPAKYQ
ncbi:hypothetical protein GGX14DRAFT_542759 [Mycena pura]|uniref:NB-ARC domain-containing protein n=1 Tax=Mycena pura TaxID=153505 RepID=A0AAD6YI66_9AGAR|nr:hypothetical protein GGX14DRAFT_542759 [Mycena pura]